MIFFYLVLFFFNLVLFFPSLLLFLNLILFFSTLFYFFNLVLKSDIARHIYLTQATLLKQTLTAVIYSKFDEKSISI